MNENEIQNDTENITENSSSSGDLQLDTDSFVWVVYPDSAGEDSAQINDNVLQGDSDIENNVDGDDDTNALADNTVPSVFTLETNTIDYSETLTQIQEEISEVNNVISAMNKVVWLLFIFLLITWAEKKITVFVNRMTKERR